VSAHDHLNRQQFVQLPMLMMARELAHHYHPADLLADETPHDLWHAKIGEAMEDDSGHPVAHRSSGQGSLYESIRTHGVIRPVAVQDPQSAPRGEKPLLWNGHHRVAVAHHLNPRSLLPVEHHESVWDAFPLHEKSRDIA
jgi:hypothetical protein